MDIYQFGQQIKQKHPEYNDMSDIEVGRKVIEKYPQYRDMLKTEQQPSDQTHSQAGSFWHTVGDVGVGVAKGLGRTAVDVAEMAKGATDIQSKINPITQAVESKFPVIKKANVAVSDFEKKMLEKSRAALQPTSTAQKIGGYAETAAEVLAPAVLVGKVAKGAVEASKEAKALQLTTDELKKINPKKLSWLTKDALSEGKTVGGVIRKKAYEIPKKVKELQSEFKDLLKGTPEEMRSNVEKYGKSMYQKTLNLFEGSEKAINKGQLLKKMEKAVINDLETVYDTKTQAAEAAKKSVKKLEKYITKGTNKGVEEARQKWYSEAKNASGKLTNANKVIHDSIKSFVRETLPEEKKAAYDAYKKTMAKTYDVEEILKAKIKASIGKSKLGEFAEKAKVPAGAIATFEGAKKLLTGNW